MKVWAQSSSYVYKNLYLKCSADIQTHFSQLQIKEIKIAYLNFLCVLGLPQFMLTQRYMCVLFSSKV